MQKINLKEIALIVLVIVTFAFVVAYFEQKLAYIDRHLEIQVSIMQDISLSMRQLDKSQVMLQERIVDSLQELELVIPTPIP